MNGAVELSIAAISSTVATLIMATNKIFSLTDAGLITVIIGVSVSLILIVIGSCF
jgi:hypothetical protein